MKMTLHETLHTRNFYRNLYRRLIKWLWLSLVCNVALAILLFFFVLNISEPNYFATNAAGAGFVSRLKAMSQPNTATKFLLAPDPPEEVQVKKFVDQ